MEGEDVDYPGHDINSTHGVATADKCCELCTNQPGCKAFTFRISDGGCWMKDTKPAKATKAGHISGARLYGEWKRN